MSHTFRLGTSLSQLSPISRIPYALCLKDLRVTINRKICSRDLSVNNILDIKTVGFGLKERSSHSYQLKTKYETITAITYKIAAPFQSFSCSMFISLCCLLYRQKYHCQSFCIIFNNPSFSALFLMVV